MTRSAEQRGPTSRCRRTRRRWRGWSIRSRPASGGPCSGPARGWVSRWSWPGPSPKPVAPCDGRCSSPAPATARACSPAWPKGSAGVSRRVRAAGRAGRQLGEAVRLCRWQRLRVILAIDDCQHLTDRADRLDLDRLVHLDPHPDSRLTVLQVFRSDEDEEPSPAVDGCSLGAADPPARLDPGRRRGVPRGKARRRGTPGAHLHSPSDHPPARSVGGQPAHARSPRLARLDGRRPARARDHHARHHRRVARECTLDSVVPLR